MAKKKHAKNVAPVDDISPVKISVTPKNQNRHAGETSKSKKTKPAEDPAPVVDAAMQCSSEDKAPVEDLSPVKKSRERKIRNKEMKKEMDEDEVLEKSFLIRAMSGLGVEKEETLRERWGTVSMKKRISIEDTLKTLEYEDFHIATRKAKLLLEAMAEMDKASST